MLLGETIARFHDEAVAGGTLRSLGDLALTARIVALATAWNVSVGEFAAQTVDRFVSTASDEDWLSLIGQMSRAQNPGLIFLQRALSNVAGDGPIRLPLEQCAQV